MSPEQSDDMSGIANATGGGQAPSASTIEPLRRVFARLAWCDQPVVRLRYLACTDTLIAHFLPLPGVRRQYIHDRLCVHFDGDDAESLPVALCLTGLMESPRSAAAQQARALLGDGVWRRAIELAASGDDEREIDLDAGERDARLAVWKEFVRGARAAMGVEILPGEIRTVLIDGTGAVLGRAVRRLDGMSPRSVVAAVGALADELRDTHRDQLAGGQLVIGVQIGGPVDREHGLVHFYNKGGHLTDEPWSDVPLGELIETAAGAATLVLNDVEALADYERWFGLGTSVNRYAVLLVSDGIGSALVVDGEVDTAMPMELGHIVIHTERKCDCGNRGCVESTAGVRALVERVGEKTDHPVATLEEAVRLVGSGGDHHSTMAEAVFRTAGQDLAIGIGSVQAIANPSAWVVYVPAALMDGSVAGQKFVSGLEEFGLWVSYKPYRKCELHLRAVTGEEGACGAALAALERFGVSSPRAAGGRDGIRR